MKYQRSRMQSPGEARGAADSCRGRACEKGWPALPLPSPSAGPLFSSSFLSRSVSSPQQGLSLYPLRSVVLPPKTQAWSSANRDFQNNSSATREERLLLPKELAKLQTSPDPAQGGEEGSVRAPVSLGDERAEPTGSLVPAHVDK